MREFSADYLSEARRGMWAADRSALAPLDLAGRERILDAGCGTGALTRVIREESGAEIVGLDADPSLLAELDAADHRLVGDATRLPVCDDAFDLVVAQALLVNLPEPARAVRAFAAASRDRVAVVEPDNDAVAVESTVEAESALARRAREAFVAGVGTDVTLGADAATLFEDAGLVDVEGRSYHHRKLVEPPYSGRDLEAARRKLRATRLTATRETLLAGGLSASEFDDLESAWREMGRAVVDQMGRQEYRRAEVVPYHVTVGRVVDGRRGEGGDREEDDRTARS